MNLLSLVARGARRITEKLTPTPLRGHTAGFSGTPTDYGEQIAPPVPRAAVPGVPLSDVVAAYASFTAHFTSKGIGDAEYWARTHSDFVHPARTLGTVLETLSAHAQDPAVQASLRQSAHELATLSLYGYGNQEAWAERVGQLMSQVRSSMKNLVELSSESAASAIPPGELLSGFATLARKLTRREGAGDVEYWMKVAADIDHLSDGLGAGLNVAAAQLPEPTRTKVNEIASEFEALSSKGDGNLDYWNTRAAELRHEVNQLASRLEEVTATV